MQVYKEVRIITARPNKYSEKIVKHKLYGYISGKNRCSALMWSERALFEITSALKKGIIPILVGGTGLYIKALIDGISDVPVTDIKYRKKAEDVLSNDGNDLSLSEIIKSISLTPRSKFILLINGFMPDS